MGGEDIKFIIEQNIPGIQSGMTLEELAATLREGRYIGGRMSQNYTRYSSGRKHKYQHITAQRLRQFFFRKDSILHLEGVELRQDQRGDVVQCTVQRHRFSGMKR